MDPEQAGNQIQLRGFLVIQNALSHSQISTLNDAIDVQRERHPGDWAEFGGAVQGGNLLPGTEAFDFVIENPAILDILRHFMGEGLTFEEFGILIRDPTDQVEAYRGWHRDITRIYERRKEIDSVQAVYYLTDVTENDHCLSIVPESRGSLPVLLSVTSPRSPAGQNRMSGRHL